MRKTLIFILFAFVVLSGILLYNTYSAKSKKISKGNAPLQLEVDPSAIAHLQKAVQIKTVSFDNPNLLDTSSFLAMHKLIDSMFPQVNTKLEKTVINSFSLIYHWKEKSNTTKPVILYAHLDVVPVESVNEKEWLHNPWEGASADGFI